MRRFLILLIAPLLCQCGSNGIDVKGNNDKLRDISTADPNVVPLTVDPGPDTLTSPYTNGLFVTATLCVPGTTTCQIIDHLLVDTGSVGVRVLESELSLPLPTVTNAAGAPLSGCTPFVDGIAWGPIKSADVYVGGEIASGISVQTIGVSTYPVPAACSRKGPAVNDLQTLGCKGIFGIGIFQQDCGTDCAPESPFSADVYFSCAPGQAGGCVRTAVAIASQVANPVARFAIDNNGSFIQLPDIPSNGSPLVNGVLVFGIGTRANNDLGGANVIQIDSNGFAATTFPAGSSATYSSFIDSGSNGLFFLDSMTAKLPACTGGLSQFYCPASLARLSAGIRMQSGGAAPVTFSVANASKLPAKSSAFNDLAGPMPGYLVDSNIPGFDWGLPFYFGKDVFTSIEATSAPGGVSPYFAF